MTPWMEGLRAQQSGQSVEANPYPKRTDRWWGWRAGWYFLGVNDDLPH